MKLSLALLIFSIIQIGCSSSYTISSGPNDDKLAFSNLNADARNQAITIFFQEDSTSAGQELLAEADTISWLNPITGARSAVPTHKIKKIVFKNRALGALEGAWIGLSIGGGWVWS